jgi:GNAT superfamily N-acetyltransferase
MLIRIAREEDAAAMARVIVDSWLVAHRDQIPAEAWEKRAKEWTYAESEQAWARTLRAIAADASPQDCIYVAEVADGELVGLVMGGPAETEGLPTTSEINALYVRPSQQGRGVGRRLVQAAAAHQAQLGRTALHIGCLAANAPGRRFYESLGGQVVAERLADEEGIMLPELVYGWADTGALLALARGEPGGTR